MTRDVTVVFRRGDAFVAHHRNVVGVRWTGAPTSEQLVALDEAHRAASAHDDVLLVNDVLRLTGSTRIDPRIHEHMRRLVVRGRDRTRAVAHVIEVPGPIGGAVRAFLRALERVAGNGRTATASFADPYAAATWLARVAGGEAWRTDVASSWRAMTRAAALALSA